MRRGDWAVGRPRRVDADERIRDVRTIFNAPNVDVAPRAADVGDGRLSLRRPDGRDARSKRCIGLLARGVGQRDGLARGGETRKRQQ